MQRTIPCAISATPKLWRKALNAKSVSLTHGECLELVAKTLGFPDWNVLAARIQSGQPTVTESGASAPATVPPSLPCGAGVPIIAMRDLVVFSADGRADLRRAR
jgi:uncharacterized protein